jgi:hypothetical protein
VAWSQPEDVVENESFLSFRRFRKSRRPFGFLPAFAEIARSKNRRPEMSGPRGEQQGPPIARVVRQMMRDVAQEHRLGNFPTPARLVPAQNKRALAGADEERDRSRGRLEIVIG